MKSGKVDTKSPLQIDLVPYNEITAYDSFDLDRIIFDLDSKIGALSSSADSLDCLISIASGLLCGALDVLWVGEFSLKAGREYASDKVDDLVRKTAKMLGCKEDDIKSCVKFLEKKFPVPSDGNTPDFGGGLQHHLRDFAHHPTIVGLVFSLLTQFTCKSYGTTVEGNFLVVDVPAASRAFIGDDIPTKIVNGTVSWFFHLVSDMAGSSSTAGLSGGTGIPGPILSLAKEIFVLPFFKNMTVGGKTLSVFLSKLFNGTLLAKRDEAGAIIKDSVLKFDLRGELGVGVELGRQAIPVIANECTVRVFYFIRRLASALREIRAASFEDIKRLNWDRIKPANDPTLARMLTIATGVFTTLDVGEAVLTQKYWVSINYVGVGRFAVAVGQDVAWCLKARNVKKIRQMYKDIKRFTYTREDDRIYERISDDRMDMDRFGLTIEQTEILYNLEYHKTLNDIRCTKVPISNEEVKRLKSDWLEEWQKYMTAGFSSFLQVEGAELHWYSKQELIEKVEQNDPTATWFRLALLEAMLFEPYYPLSVEKDKKGNDVPSKRYKDLQNPLAAYKKGEGDVYLDQLFTGAYYPDGYIKRLRKCYGKVQRELNEVLKSALTSVAVAAGIAIVVIASAGAFAPTIAVALVGSNFAGLSGAALTSACLAYLGGGAVAIGGAGVAGGTMAIVGGGAALGLGVGAGVGGAVSAAGLAGKKNTIRQSSKLLVAVREIFLNDEHDLAYSNSIYEQYVRNIAEIEKGLVELRLKADVASGKEKKLLKAEIKEAEDSVEAMKIARKSMAKFASSFETGLAQQ